MKGMRCAKEAGEHKHLDNELRRKSAFYLEKKLRVVEWVRKREKGENEALCDSWYAGSLSDESDECSQLGEALGDLTASRRAAGLLSWWSRGAGEHARGRTAKSQFFFV